MQEISALQFFVHQTYIDTRFVDVYAIGYKWTTSSMAEELVTVAQYQ